MQKEAINTFSEGLVTDINPIAAQNNSLSNCLNGTFITYNGNEFILQNDMGNSKIEYAKLPTGYVPVGIKEYGGVIYVASYNPMTKKGQVGSFPSPQHIFTPTEIGVSDITLTEENFLTNGLYHDVRIPLTADDKILNINDQFAIKITATEPFQDSVFNVVSNLIPDNLGIIKFKLAALDKNSEFIYIDTKITQKESTLFKGEDEEVTFDYWAVINGDIEIEDFDIYNLKASGKLYLVAELEVLDKYVIELTNSVVGSTYTCTLNNEITNPGLWTFLKVTYSINGETEITEYIPHPIDLKGNLVNTPPEFTFSTTTKTDVVDYECTPCVAYGEQSQLTKRGRINFSTFDTNFLDLIGFNYQKLDEEINLNINIDYGSTIGNSIDRLELNFYNLNKLTTYTHVCTERDFKSINFVETIPIYNIDKINAGLIGEELSLNTPKLTLPNFLPKGLEENCVYMCVFKFYEKTIAGLVTEVVSKKYRFVYTNTMFNKYYNGTILDINNEFIDFNANLKVDLNFKKAVTYLLNPGKLPYCFDTNISAFDSELVEQKIFTYNPRIALQTEEFDEITTTLGEHDYWLFEDVATTDGRLYNLNTVGNQILNVNTNKDLIGENIDSETRTYQYFNTALLEDDIYLRTIHDSTNFGITETLVYAQFKHQIKADTRISKITKALNVVKPYFSEENLTNIFGFNLDANNDKWITYRWGISGRFNPLDSSISNLLCTLP